MDELPGMEISNEAEKNRGLRWNERSQDRKYKYLVLALILDAVKLRLGSQRWGRHKR